MTLVSGGDHLTYGKGMKNAEEGHGKGTFSFSSDNLRLRRRSPASGLSWTLLHSGFRTALVILHKIPFFIEMWILGIYKS